MLSRLTQPITILYSLPGILIGLVFHEFMHAYAAYRCGDPTAKNAGRLSLNPMAHLDPIGTIMLILVGYGWARPVPVNSRNFKNARSGSLLVSLAGPLANLCLSLVFYIIYAIMVLGRGNVNTALYSIVTSAYYTNIVLFLFNLIPLPPLDGFHVLCCLFPKINIQTIWKLQRYSTIILVVLMLSNVLDYYLSWGASLITLCYSKLIGLFL